jgi:hypothetical protein
MGFLDFASTFGPDLGQVSFEVLHPVPTGLPVEGGSDPLKQTGVTLRPKKHPQQFPSDPRVIDQPGADLMQSDPFLRAAGKGPIREEVEGDVPVPDAPHQARQALQSPVVPCEFGPRCLRKESQPDPDADPEATKITVQSMEGGGGRPRIGDEAVQFVQGGVESGLEALDELGDRGRWRSRTRHG